MEREREKVRKPACLATLDGKKAARKGEKRRGREVVGTLDARGRRGKKEEGRGFEEEEGNLGRILANGARGTSIR